MPGAAAVNAVPAPFTVFVCSTFDDLQPEREGVLDAIRRVQQRHNAMEFFGAREEQPTEACLPEPRKSDLLVVIVAHKYGNVVPATCTAHCLDRPHKLCCLGKREQTLLNYNKN